MCPLPQQTHSYDAPLAGIRFYKGAKMIVSYNKRVRTMNKKEILAKMEWYGFIDKEGHVLRLCKEFIELANAYIGLREGKQ